MKFHEIASMILKLLYDDERTDTAKLIGIFLTFYYESAENER
jgi:hypothetical protein